MTTRPTIKLEIEVYQDNIEEFFLSLYHSKYSLVSGNHTDNIVHSIQWDKEKLAKEIFDVTKYLPEIERRLTELYEYLKKHSKFSDQYEAISKDSLENFMNLSFVQNLKEEWIFFEIVKQWIGTGDKIRFKISLYMMDFLYTSLGKPYADPLLRYFLRVCHSHLETKSASPDTPSNIHEQMEVLLGIRVFLESNGKIVYHKKSSEPFSYLFYYQKGTSILKINKKTTGISVQENTHAEIIDQKLVCWPQNKISEDTVSEDELMTFLIAYFNKITITESEEDFDTNVSYIYPPIRAAMLVDYLIDFFPALINGIESKKTYLEYQDKLLIRYFDLIRTFYPDLTLHTYANVTGYIGSLLRLLDTNDQHTDSERKRQNHNEYLRKTVINTLKRNHISL